MLKVQRLSTNATIPKRAHDGDAGLDLTSTSDMIVYARSRALVPTGLAMQIPSGHYGKVSSRSSLSHGFGIEVGAGTVDSTYRGSVGVVLFNHSDKDFEIHIGDRIAQLILVKILCCDAIEVTDVNNTTRGDGGFGSSGIHEFVVERKS